MRLRTIALVAAGCGGSSAAPAIDAAAADPDAPRVDAATSYDCEAAATAWREAIDGLRFCETPDDCVLAGVDSASCDADNIGCGALVNAAAYEGSEAPAIEAAYFEAGCRDGVEECSYPAAIECRDNRCAAILWRCGLASSVSGEVWVLDARAPGRAELGTGARIEVRYELPGTGTLVLPAYSDLDTSGLVPEGCETHVYAADHRRPDSFDAGAVSIAGAALAIPPCSFDSARGTYACVVTEGSPAAGDSITSVGGGQLEVALAARPFAVTHVGHALRIEGALDPAAASMYPIVAFIDAAHIRVGPAAWTGTTAWEIGGS